MVGLVLEGGAMRGMYTAGVIDSFLKNNIKIDGILGVSAGVLFGINYQSKQFGRVIRYNKKYAKNRKYMSFWSLLTTGDYINKKFAYYTVPIILDPFDEVEYEKSNCKMYATVTNIETGKAEFIEVKKPIEEMELLRATASMPFVSKMVEYKGKKYLDGGISDSIPYEELKKLGYDKIIVVLTRPKEYRKKKQNRLITKIKYGKYKNLVKAINERHINYNQELDKLNELEKNNEIFVIRPSIDLHIKRTEKNEDKLQEMYDLGFNNSNNKMNELKNFIG